MSGAIPDDLHQGPHERFGLQRMTVQVEPPGFGEKRCAQLEHCY